MTILALLRKLFKTLASDGTPAEVAAGIMLGAALGLTPLVNLHNLLLFAIAILLRVSLPGFFLGWALFVPLGFLLDPLFDALGTLLLMDAGGLRPIWTGLYNAPVIALSNFNNTVVLGSFLVWVVGAFPIYLAAKRGVSAYRSSIHERLMRTPLFKTLKTSKVYNWYRMLRPE